MEGIENIELKDIKIANQLNFESSYWVFRKLLKVIYLKLFIHV